MICDECRNKHCTCGSSLVQDEELNQFRKELKVCREKLAKEEKRSNSLVTSLTRAREMAKLASSNFAPLEEENTALHAQIEELRAGDHKACAKKVELLERDVAALRERAEKANRERAAAHPAGGRLPGAREPATSPRRRSGSGTRPTHRLGVYGMS